MKAERTKPAARQRLSAQLAALIEAATISRCELARRTKVDKAQLSRFVHGQGQLTTGSLDRIGDVLRLRLVQDPE